MTILRNTVKNVVRPVIKPVVPGFSWSSYWAAQSEVLLFFAETKNIADGKLYNQMSGSTDYLTVAGSPNTFQCPNTAAYIAADTADRIWFNTDTNQNVPTTAELIGYDFTRTLIKYLDASPYTIEWIAILKPAATVTDKMRDSFHLSVWWDNVLSAHGYVKGNRGAGQSVWTNVYSVILDGDSTGWYQPRLAAGRQTNEGADEIYWDMLYGSSNLGAEQSSGATLTNIAYLITATDADFFYTGCQVGDIFFCALAKTCTAARKVRRYTGNHLGQRDVTKRPVNGLFDGSDDSMRTNATEHALVQPIFVYLLFKQITWTNTDMIFDGTTLNTTYMHQANASPKLRVSAGTPSDYDSLTLDTWGIARVYFNGANSKFIINNNVPITGNFGSNNMAGLQLGARGGPALFGHIQVAEIILRKNANGEVTLYNYLDEIKATL